MATNFTRNEVRTLARKAQRGDGNALKELQRIALRTGQNANRRIKTMEKSGYQNAYALRKANAFNKRAGRKRFMENAKSKNIEALKQSALEAITFLNSKTGSKAGYEDYRRNMSTALEKRGLQSDDETILRFEEFANSELFKEYVRFDSEQALEDAINLANAGGLSDDFEEIFKRYQNGDITLSETWDYATGREIYNRRNQSRKKE